MTTPPLLFTLLTLNHVEFHAGLGPNSSHCHGLLGRDHCNALRYTQHVVVWDNYRAGIVALNEPKNVGEAKASARLSGEIEGD